MAMRQRQISLEVFLGLPEVEPPREFEEGRIIEKVSPKGRHSRLQWTLSELFNRLGAAKRLAVAFPELRTTFGGRSYVPDVAVYSWERVPTTADGTVADDFLIPPDLVVEIASPQQSANALLRRCLWYVANGVPIAWLVDPTDESVAVFHPSRLPRARRGADTLEVGDLLPDFDLTAEALFETLRLR